MNTRFDHAELLQRARQAAQAGEASEVLKLTRTLDPQTLSADDLSMVGLACQQLGDIATALNWLQRAAQLNDSTLHRNNLANVLRDAGNPTAAVTEYRLALQGNPQCAEVWCNLGTTLAELGAIDDAISAFQAATQHGPQLADAHGALGVLLSHRGNQVAAVDALCQALQLDPGRAAFHDALGLALQRNDDFTAACTAHEHAVRLNSTSAESWNNLGHALRVSGQTQAAIGCLNRALELSPEFVEAHNNLGIAHQDCGQLIAAESCFRRAIDLRADYPDAHFNLAELRRFQPDDDRLGPLKLVTESAKTLEHREAALLHFALGKAWDDLQSPALAFEHWSQANSLVRRDLRYDEPTTLLMLRALREKIIDLTMTETGRLEHRSSEHRCVFIIGLPRSGSTLIEQVLAAHPQVHSRGETPLLERLLRAAHGGITAKPSELIELSAAQVRDVREKYLAAVPSTKLSVDKFLGNGLYIAAIRKIFPEAQILHIKRHPLDIALSCFSKRFVSGHAYSYDLEELARYIVAFQDVMLAYEKKIPQEFMRPVQYEDFVDDFAKQVRHLLEFVGLPWNDRCLEFHKHTGVVATASAAQVREPLNRRGVKRWLAYRQQLEPAARILNEHRND